MTLAAQHVARQLPGVVDRFQERYHETLAAVEAGRAALADWASDPAAADRRIAAAMAASPRPFALSFEEPVGVSILPPPVRPLTAVATDGSTIPVDRFSAIPCYVVNIGVVALAYGVEGGSLLEAWASVGPGGPGSRDPDMTAGGLDLLRDVLELESAAEVGLARLANGPTAVILDGTLLPWDLESPQIDPAVRTTLRARTADALDRLRRASGELALGAYISASRSSDVSLSLSALLASARMPLPGDGFLFRGLLGHGERSSVFRARSERSRRVEEHFSADQEVCFFYFRHGDDVARVELPRWAATPVRLDLLHAVLVDQCDRCDGYPRALQEAHEQAIITMADRDLFTRLLDRESARAGLPARMTGKLASKRRRAV